MNKFKIGDKVIITTHGGWYEVGEVFTLTKPYKDHGWCTKEKGEGYFIHSENMELYKPSPKFMLQNGMRVKCRNGCMYTYLDGYFTNINFSSNGLTYLSEVESWTDDLDYYRGGDTESEWDVIEIFASSYIFDYFNYKKVTKSLWKREYGTESEKQLKILQDQIQTLTEQAIKLGEQIKLEKL